MVVVWLWEYLASYGAVLARHRWNLCAGAIVHCSMFTNCDAETFCLFGKFLCIMVKIMVSNKVQD